MACCCLVVLVLQESKGKGQESVCGAVMWRCVVLRWLLFRADIWGNPHLPFLKHAHTILPSLPHPKYPNTPLGLNNFLLAKTGASGSMYAADRGMCRHFFFFSPALSTPVFLAMHNASPHSRDVSAKNCLMTEHWTAKLEFVCFAYEATKVKNSSRPAKDRLLESFFQLQKGLGVFASEAKLSPRSFPRP